VKSKYHGGSVGPVVYEKNSDVKIKYNQYHKQKYQPALSRLAKDEMVFLTMFVNVPIPKYKHNQDVTT
jgi:hypothetical protein